MGGNRAANATNLRNGSSLSWKTNLSAPSLTTLNRSEFKTFYKGRKGEQNPNSINIPKQITDTVDPLNSTAGGRS